MIEFGARLSLKDNMYATLQKNLKMQKQFSEQVKRTSDNIKALGKAKVAPVIQAKDKATSTINKVKNQVKTVGKMVAKPFVALKDRASPILSKIKGTLKSVGSAIAKPIVAIKDTATAGLSKIKGVLSTLAKGVKIAVGIAGVGASLLLGGSLSEGASLEQSIGGVETLFKGDAGAVKANADMAFKTAGLSANAYMEQVTSFSASLLNSLGGDTAKSAQIADMAIIDMADNANKFGTDMASIQNAYQGFAKKNYTMLDNLKLGYGGTQEEMQRLLSDAQKLTGVKYNINNLSDVYSAIHAIQENMGVAGTTAKEASQTFSGSFASMKASFSNLLGNMAIGGDVEGSMQELVESASTFLFNNAIPMIGRVIKALPKAISTGIKSASPQIKEAGGDIAKSLKDGLLAILPASVSSAFGNVFNNMAPVVKQLGGMFERVAPVIANTLGNAFKGSGDGLSFFANMVSSAIPIVESVILALGDTFNYVMPIVTQVIQIFRNAIQQTFPIVSSAITTALNVIMPIVSLFAGLIQSALPIVEGIIQTFSNVVATIFPVVQNIFQGLGDKIAQIVTVVTSHMGLFQSIFEVVAPIVESAVGVIANVFSGAWDIISPIIDIAITVFDAVLTKVEEVFPTIQSIIENVWGFLEPIFTALGDGLSKIGDGIGKVSSWIGDKLSGGGNSGGFAYGKNRVPYDNYPARLHQGEKILTRNQADQYDRAMGTRGVQLGQAPISASQSTTASAGGTTVNIEKLADTVVIEKEADVDKVVEEMITKFRKLVPNIA